MNRQRKASCSKATRKNSCGVTAFAATVARPMGKGSTTAHELVKHLEKREDAAQKHTSHALKWNSTRKAAFGLSKTLFHPYEWPRRMWIGLMLLMTIAELGITPFFVAFYTEAASGNATAMESDDEQYFYSMTAVHWVLLFVPTTFALIDIPYTMLSGHDTGLTIDWDSHRHFSRYMSDGVAMLDFVALFPWWALPSMPREFHLIRLLRVSKLPSLAAPFAPAVASTRKLWVYELFEVIVCFVIALHICACVAHHVGDIDADELIPHGSLVSAGGGIVSAASEPIGDAYVRAIFCACALFSGEPGAGGLVLRSRSAMLVGSFIMFIGATYMAVLFGWVAQALERANITKLRFREHMQVINEDMGFRGLDEETRERICKRYEYAWRKHRDYLKKPEDSFMDNLCPSFNLERLKHVTDSIMAMIYEEPRGSGMGDPSHGVAEGNKAMRRGLAALATRLKPMFFLPGDVLMYEGDRARLAFFLVRGEVEVRVQPDNRVVRKVGDNEFFGEIALLAQADSLWQCVEHYARLLRKQLGERSKLATRNGTVVASMLCDVLSLKVNDLIDVQQIFPEVVDRISERSVRRLADVSEQEDTAGSTLPLPAVLPPPPPPPLTPPLMPYQQRSSTEDSDLWASKRSTYDGGMRGSVAPLDTVTAIHDVVSRELGGAVDALRDELRNELREMRRVLLSKTDGEAANAQTLSSSGGNGEGRSSREVDPSRSSSYQA